MKKFFLTTVAAALSCVMLSTPVAASGSFETESYLEQEATGLMINNKDVFLQNGEYFTYDEGKKIRVIMPWEGEIVSNPDLIEWLNESTNDCITSNGYSIQTSSPYPSGWQQQREVDISDGSTYSERVNLELGRYYSPSFITNFSNNSGNSVVSVDFYNIGVTETKTISATIYTRSTDTGEWEEVFDKNLGYSIWISKHNLFSGTQTSHIDRVCFIFTDVTSNWDEITGPYPKLFTYSISQV